MLSPNERHGDEDLNPEKRIWSPPFYRYNYLRINGVREWSRTTNNKYLRLASLPLEYTDKNGGRYRTRTCRDLLSESSMTASCINRPIRWSPLRDLDPDAEANGFEPFLSAYSSKRRKISGRGRGIRTLTSVILSHLPCCQLGYAPKFEINLRYSTDAHKTCARKPKPFRKRATTGGVSLPRGMTPCGVSHQSGFPSWC